MQTQQAAQNVDNSTYVVSLEEYKNIITNYCNRIYREQCMSIEQYNNNGNIMYSIKFHQPEWFTELNDDLKHNIILNIQNHYQDIIKNMINEINDDNSNSKIVRKRKHQEICNDMNCDCDCDNREDDDDDECDDDECDDDNCYGCGKQGD